MFDIQSLISDLARTRPVFHSEADFQHAIAWEIHRQVPDAGIRLELPIRVDPGTIHVDVWVSRGERALAVELKYKTRRLSVSVVDEEFALANHSAQDLGRYDFIKDIERLEQLVSCGVCAHGYAILLTNDSGYWSEARSATIDEDFRLHGGRMLSGELQWRGDAAPGTIRGRERPLRITGAYPIEWQNYAHVGASGHGVFRYLCVSV